jgi:hypothetical protein
MEALTFSGTRLTENLLRIGEKSGSDSAKWKGLGGVAKNFRLVSTCMEHPSNWKTGAGRPNATDIRHPAWC